MLNLQLDQFVYGLLGLPEQITVFDADDGSLQEAAEHLAKLRFTGEDLLELFVEWVDEVKSVNEVPDQEMQINLLDQKLERLENMVSDIVTPDTGEFSVDDLFDEEYEDQVPPDETDELSDEYLTVDKVVGDQIADDDEETEEETQVEDADEVAVSDEEAGGEDISPADVVDVEEETPSKEDSENVKETDKEEKDKLKDFEM